MQESTHALLEHMPAPLLAGLNILLVALRRHADSCSLHGDSSVEVPRLLVASAPDHAWVGAAQQLRAASESGHPRILQLGTAAAGLLPAWTPSTLASEVSNLTLTRVYISSQPRFGPYFDERRPLARMSRAIHNYSETSMSAEAFFEGTHGHAYYSAEAGRDLSPELISELQPLESLLVLLNPSHSSVNVWFGREPVSAPCHFDGYQCAACTAAVARAAMRLHATTCM